nr:hypothetical protein [Tanacetum cinerariifolium]
EHDAEKPESAVNLSPSSSAQSGRQDDITKKKDKGKSPVEYFTGNKDSYVDSEDYSKDSNNNVSAASPIVSTAGQNYSNSTNPISAAGPSNNNISPTHGKSSLQDAFQMLDREDITYYDHKNVGGEADFNNLETSITVSPILTTRTNKDHRVAQIIGDRSSTTQTRSMTRVIRDQCGISQILNEDFHTFMFACFLSQEEPKRVKQKEYGIFINQDKYVAEILKKFGLTKGKSASTLIDTKKPLLKDPDGVDVDVHIYRSMIGSLIYHQDQTSCEGFNQIIDFLNGSYIAYALTMNPTIYVNCIKQFWNTVAVKQSNDITRLQALVNKKKVVVTEAAIRDALHLDDAEGVDCLPNEDIFTALTRIGHVSSKEPEEQGDAEEQIDAEEHGNDDNAAGETVTAVDDVEDQSIQLPTPLTSPPKQPQDIPSTSQAQSPLP